MDCLIRLTFLLPSLNIVKKQLVNVSEFVLITIWLVIGNSQNMEVKVTETLKYLIQKI